MPIVAFIAVAFLPILLGLAFILGRRYARRDEPDEGLSAVSKQHFELFQGGELNPVLVERAKDRFQTMLDRGDVAAVEASMRPGEHYVVQVRALAELGTETAAKILERQLQRHLSDDHLEQTWYRIDLVSGLRHLNREESLPQLLRCADFVADAPLGPVFAAETMGFLGFAGYLRQPSSNLGRAALRILHRVIEGFRVCLPPQVVIETRLGEMVEAVWDAKSKPAHPLAVRVLQEARRYIRRIPAAQALLDEESSEHEAFLWQVSRLEGLEPAIADYLDAVGPELISQLAKADDIQRRDLLIALRDLRVEAADALLPLISRPDFPDMDLAMEVLAWSQDSRVGPFLRDLGHREVSMENRAKKRRAGFGLRDRVSVDFPYEGLLHALRYHPSKETEDFLLLAARDREPRFRMAALSGFGWWEPVAHREVIQCLEEARRDLKADVRRAARAALARLGERSALNWFRQALSSRDPRQMHEAIHFIASEGLTLLWPDLDRLADSENPEVSYHAKESLVILSEEMDHGRR